MMFEHRKLIHLTNVNQAATINHVQTQPFYFFNHWQIKYYTTTTKNGLLLFHMELEQHPEEKKKNLLLNQQVIAIKLKLFYQSESHWEKYYFLYFADETTTTQNHNGPHMINSWTIKFHDEIESSCLDENGNLYLMICAHFYPIVWNQSLLSKPLPFLMDETFLLDVKLHEALLFSQIPLANHPNYFFQLFVDLNPKTNYFQLKVYLVHERYYAYFGEEKKKLTLLIQIQLVPLSVDSKQEEMIYASSHCSSFAKYIHTSGFNEEYFVPHEVLMDPSKGYYNQETDSVQLLVQMKDMKKKEQIHNVILKKCWSRPSAKSYIYWIPKEVLDDILFFI
jgi:hypothetical protein